ncbi:hypothetical protein PUNSTDRAFT_31961, partial [Punctularia strigosozonata HHB-11173 SS5]
MTKYLPGEESRVLDSDIRRLATRKNLTYIIDGWEDRLGRSVYGSIVSEVGHHPVILGLEDMTGRRANADAMRDVSQVSLTKKSVDISQILCVCTDNPTTMRAFRRKWETAHPHLLTIPCFMHGINTIIGKVVAYPAMKRIASQNARIVSFFNSSHYWGGQVDMLAHETGVKRSMKTNTESRFYALVLQCMSTRDHRDVLKRIAIRDDAQRSIRGLSPVNKDVLAFIMDSSHWLQNDQLIRITRPLVDIIGNIEGRDANLADCMLELIWAHREVNRRLAYEEGDDIGFLSHTRRTLNDQFHAMNTDLHWFALFLHPLCRRLAVSSASHSRNITAAVSIALGIAYKWRWTKTQTQKLITDIKNYGIVKDSFGGAKADGKAWWEELVVDAREHPLKTMAVRILTIVPHAADVERLFSSLGGIQSVRRSQLTIPHMETLGALRNYYNAELHDLTVKMGKQTRRRHAHMHTRDEPGVDAARAQELLASFVWT